MIIMGLVFLILAALDAGGRAATARAEARSADRNDDNE
jgi:hypothetical protein